MSIENTNKCFVCSYEHTDKHSPIKFKLSFRPDEFAENMGDTLQGYLYPEERKLVIINTETFAVTNWRIYELLTRSMIPIRAHIDHRDTTTLVEFSMDSIPGFVASPVLQYVYYLVKNTCWSEIQLNSTIFDPEVYMSQTKKSVPGEKPVKKYEAGLAYYKATDKYNPIVFELDAAVFKPLEYICRFDVVERKLFIIPSDHPNNTKTTTTPLSLQGVRLIQIGKRLSFTIPATNTIPGFVYDSKYDGMYPTEVVAPWLYYDSIFEIRLDSSIFRPEEYYDRVNIDTMQRRSQVGPDYTTPLPPGPQFLNYPLYPLLVMRNTINTEVKKYPDVKLAVEDDKLEVYLVQKIP